MAETLNTADRRPGITGTVKREKNRSNYSAAQNSSIVIKSSSFYIYHSITVRRHLVAAGHHSRFATLRGTKVRPPPFLHSSIAHLKGHLTLRHSSGISDSIMACPISFSFIQILLNLSPIPFSVIVVFSDARLIPINHPIHLEVLEALPTHSFRDCFGCNRGSSYFGGVSYVNLTSRARIASSNPPIPPLRPPQPLPRPLLNHRDHASCSGKSS